MDYLGPLPSSQDISRTAAQLYTRTAQGHFLPYEPTPTERIGARVGQMGPFFQCRTAGICSRGIPCKGLKSDQTKEVVGTKPAEHRQRGATRWYQARIYVPAAMTYTTEIDMLIRIALMSTAVSTVGYAIGFKWECLDIWKKICLRIRRVQTSQALVSGVQTLGYIKAIGFNMMVFSAIEPTRVEVDEVKRQVAIPRSKLGVWKKEQDPPKVEGWRPSLAAILPNNMGLPKSTYKSLTVPRRDTPAHHATPRHGEKPPFGLAAAHLNCAVPSDAVAQSHLLEHLGGVQTKNYTSLRNFGTTVELATSSAITNQIRGVEAIPSSHFTQEYGTPKKYLQKPHRATSGHASTATAAHHARPRHGENPVPLDGVVVKELTIDGEAVLKLSMSQSKTHEGDRPGPRRQIVGTRTLPIPGLVVVLTRQRDIDAIGHELSSRSRQQKCALPLIHNQLTPKRDPELGIIYQKNPDGSAWNFNGNGDWEERSPHGASFKLFIWCAHWGLDSGAMHGRLISSASRIPKTTAVQQARRLIIECTGSRSALQSYPIIGLLPTSVAGEYEHTEEEEEEEGVLLQRSL
ncbi:hypothetical protein B0H16DRAFT_1478761 [Mycena metata]|uniref:Uncharacterized protein n=1 Tax=Mycena metata TaxID=1033252 RepID=A0AAD7MEW9_9AGAR|nr:hypothetical protein B0H16DRAFT_1478761 [Mycena metata]